MSRWFSLKKLSFPWDFLYDMLWSYLLLSPTPPRSMLLSPPIQLCVLVFLFFLHHPSPVCALHTFSGVWPCIGHGWWPGATEKRSPLPSICSPCQDLLSQGQDLCLPPHTWRVPLTSLPWCPPIFFFHICKLLEAASLLISPGRRISTQPQFWLFPKWRACEFLSVQLQVQELMEVYRPLSTNQAGNSFLDPVLPLPKAIRRCFCSFVLLFTF